MDKLRLGRVRIKNHNPDACAFLLALRNVPSLLDHFAILARRLNLKPGGGPVWAVRTEGVLAVDRALTLTKPCTVRIVSIGGMGVNLPTHMKVMPGYPIQKIKDQYVFEPAKNSDPEV